MEDGDKKTYEIDSLKTAVFDLKKRAELGQVRPIVEYLGAEKIKELQRRTEDAEEAKRLYSRIANDKENEALNAHKAIDQLKDEIEQINSENQNLKNSLKMSSNQIQALKEDNQRTKMMFDGIQQSKDLSKSIPLDKYEREVENFELQIRDLEAKVALLTLERNDLDKALREQKRVHKTIAKARNESNEKTRTEFASTIKTHPYPEKDYQYETEYENPDTKIDYAQLALSKIDSKSKDATIVALRKEAEGLHQDLLEYRKLTIDTKNKLRDLETINEVLVKENEKLKKSIESSSNQLNELRGQELANPDIQRDSIYIDALRARVVELESELERTHVQLRDTKKRLELEQTGGYYMEDSHESRSNITKKLKQDLAMAEVQVQDLNRRLEEQQITIQNLRQVSPKTGSNQNKIQIDREEYEKMKEELGNLRVAESKIMNLQRDLDDIRVA